MMFTTTILTSWAGCPQSRLYQDVVARGDRHSVRVLTRVARQWDHTLAPGWLTRLVPRRLQPAPFDPVDYAGVVAGLPAESLWLTVEHVGWLRTQSCVRSSLRSVAFLEAFETVVAEELEERARVRGMVLAPPDPQPQPRRDEDSEATWPVNDATRRVSP